MAHDPKHAASSNDPHFAPEVAQQHLAEDSEAWNGVVTLLLFIVTMGVCLMTATVFLGR